MQEGVVGRKTFTGAGRVLLLREMAAWEKSASRAEKDTFPIRCGGYCARSGERKGPRATNNTIRVNVSEQEGA